MHVNFVLSLSCALLVALGSMAMPAGSHSGDDSWIITEDTRIVGGTHEIHGNLTITSGAKLTLAGSHLRIGGLLHVLPGAVLELHPSNGIPSRLSALGGGTGFWIRVDGEMHSRGEPASVVNGLWGDGLLSTLTGKGGLQVNGRAVFHDIHLHDGSAGIFVAEGAEVEMHDSTVEGLGESGVTVLGTLRLSNTTVAENGIGLVAKDTCQVDVKDSLFRANQMESLLINGCRAIVHGSVIDGGGVGIAANNAAQLSVHDSIIRDYSIDALNAFSSRSDRPVVRIHDVQLIPGPDAKRGADIEGSRLAEFVNVTIMGHTSHGIQAKQSTLLIRDSTIQGNGGHGVFLAGGHFQDDPLSNNNSFGSQTPGPPNGKAPISHLAIVQSWSVDADGRPVYGDTSLSVHRLATGEPVEAQSTRELSHGGRQVIFETFTSDPDGRPQYIGPFGYRVSHSTEEKSTTGELDLADPLILNVLATEGQGRWTVAWFVSAAIFLAGAAIFAYGLRRSRRPEAGTATTGTDHQEP